MEQNRNNIFAFLAIIILIVVAYASSINNQFTNWDDDVYVTSNPAVWSLNAENIGEMFTQPMASNYHPLTMMSLAVSYSISENDPKGYIVTNILFHILNACLVFIFIMMLTKKQFWASFLVTLLFAIHPMHVESVAWISERKDVLYSLFFLGGLISYLKYQNHQHYKWLILTFLLCVLSLLSKPAAVIFPLVLLLLDWYKGRSFDKRAIIEKTPFFALSILFGVITLNIQSATALGDQFGFLEKVIFAGHGFFMYWFKLLIPTNLSPLYAYPVSQIPSTFYLGLVASLLLLVASIYSLKKDKIIFFGFAFFVINVILVLQLITVGNALMADRYTYLSSIGLFFILGIGFEKLIANPKFKTLAIGAVAIYVLALTYLSNQQCKVWENSETLWSQAIKVDDQNYLAYSKRGLAQMQVGKAQKALADFNQCIKINPNYFAGFTNRGYLYFKSNQLDKALIDYNQSIKLNPSDYKTFNNRGHLFYKQEKLEEALTDYNKSIELNPNYYLAYNNRAIIYHTQGDKQKALDNYDRALALNPYYESAQKNRALLLNQQ